jgi:hypothetical protein
MYKIEHVELRSGWFHRRNTVARRARHYLFLPPGVARTRRRDTRVICWRASMTVSPPRHEH